MLWLCLRLPRLAHEAQAPLHEALERLAAWGYQWSSWVSYRLTEEPLLWLELGASRSLYGGHAALLQQLLQQLAQLGYQNRYALAPSPSAAALLSRLDEPSHILTPEKLRTRLDNLPLSLLEQPADTLAALHAVGLRRIGELLQQDAAALARRFGPQMPDYLQRLYAQRQEPLPAWQPPAIYRTRCEFDGTVHETTALLFPLQRLLLEFQGYLRGCDRAVLRFELQLEHPHHPSTRVALGLSSPGREASQFLRLIRERFANLILPTSVSGLALEASEFTAPSVQQADFFGSDSQQLAELSLLLDRLRARLGEPSVQTPGCRADYRPEQASRTLPAGRVLREPHTQELRELPIAARPCWLLPAPRPIETPGQLLEGPERIESGWWDGGEIVRDYYVALDMNGARCWVFRDRTDERWYLHGLWA